MGLRLFILTLAFCVIGASAPPTPPAANAPATTQASDGGVIRGKVTLASGLSLQKPDLSRIVVYLAEDPTLTAQPGPTTRATVSQFKKTFTPNFLVVPRGTEVEFPNWDKFDHNVFSRSAAAPAFDLERYPYGQSKTRTFDKLGVVQVFCNIHPQMRAVIYVTPNRYFARCDAEGNFEIANVPAGNFEVVAWQDRCEEQRQAVAVKSGEPAELNITLKENRDRAMEAAGDRTSYGGVEKGLGVKREKLNLPVVTDAHPAPPDSRP